MSDITFPNGHPLHSAPNIGSTVGSDHTVASAGAAARS